MKEVYPGYFPLSDETKSRLWADATVVFDANIILNLCRYSKSTRDDYIGVMQSLEKRIWIPNQVAFEYLSNRSSVILEQEANHAEFLSKLNSTIDILKQPRSHPFIDEVLQTKIEVVFAELDSHISKGKAAVRAMIKDDDVLNSVSSMFAGRVGAGHSDSELMKIFEEGSRRFLEKIPPGFRDISKSDKSETMANKRKIYGDLIVWKEVIEHARENSVDVIFITDDEKEDWWRIERGQKIGPRPELINEFYSESKKNILILNSYKFLELANNYVVDAVKESSVSEVKDTHQQSEELRDEFFQKLDDVPHFDMYRELDGDVDKLNEKELIKRDYINRLTIKLHGIKSEIDDIDRGVLEAKSKSDVQSFYKKIVLSDKRKVLLKRKSDIQEAIRMFELDF